MPILTANPASPCKRPVVTALFLSAACLLLATSIGVRAAPIGFTAQNIDFVANPTAMEFGPDGRLYVAELKGTIVAYTIERDPDTLNLCRAGPGSHRAGSRHSES